MQMVWNRAQKAVIFCFHGGGGDMERQAGECREWISFYGRIKTTIYFNEKSNFCRIVNSVLSGALSLRGGLKWGWGASPFGRGQVKGAVKFLDCVSKRKETRH